MGIDWAGLLARKYDIMQQGADTARLGMVASANLDNTRAGVIPAESKANIGLTNAQTGLAGANATLAGANARNVDETTKYVGPLASANIFATRAQGGLYSSQANLTNQDARFAPFTFRGLGASLGATDATSSSYQDPLRSTLRLGIRGDYR